MITKLYIGAAKKMEGATDAARGLRVGLALAPGITYFGSIANAQTREVTADTVDIINATGIQGILCNIVNTLTGPLGIAIGILVLAIGGLMIAFGGKRSISFVIWGVIGVGVALAAPALAKTLFPTTLTSLCETAPAAPAAS